MTYKILLRDKLKNQFGHNDYKNYLQKKATEAVYIGKKDIYICMPSGFGKSLCFQLPMAIKDNSFAIVISPTIAYSKNQVDYLKSKNILAYNWNGYTPKTIKSYIKKNMKSSNPKMKLLYITPEIYLSSYFQLILKNIKQNVLSYLVIDEVHCVSPLGHDFKHFYRKLFKWPQKRPSVPIIAVTATAIKEVREDIFITLKMKDPLIFSMPVFRSNLFYDVWFIDTLLDPLKHLKKFIEESLGLNNTLIQKEERNCGIIFCQTRDTALTLTNLLNSIEIPTVFYNTRSNIQTRFQIQDLWNSGEVNVIVTTSSFGIGINKRTVRFIVHWYTVSSIGNYYQQSGRAGHDGKTSYCRIYCYLNKINTFHQNFDQQKYLIPRYQNQQIHLRTKILLFIEIIKNIVGIECRHALIAKYFGDPTPMCQNQCDICKDKNAIKERISQLKYFQEFNSNFNELFKSFNLYKNDFEKVKLYEHKQINIYKHSQSEIKILMKYHQKLEANIFDINKKSTVTSLYHQKSHQFNCIDNIQNNKISKSTHKEYNSSIHHISYLELQLKTINKILYTRQIEKILSSIKSVDNRSKSTLMNICETVFVKNESEACDTKKLKIVENTNEIKINI